MNILKIIIITLVVVVDIYILGIIDLFSPVIYGIIFVLANYAVYYFCFKTSKDGRKT